MKTVYPLTFEKCFCEEDSHNHCTKSNGKIFLLFLPLMKTGINGICSRFCPVAPRGFYQFCRPERGKHSCIPVVSSFALFFIYPCFLPLPSFFWPWIRVQKSGKGGKFRANMLRSEEEGKEITFIWKSGGPRCILMLPSLHIGVDAHQVWRPCCTKPHLVKIFGTRYIPKIHFESPCILVVSSLHFSSGGAHPVWQPVAFVFCIFAPRCISAFLWWCASSILELLVRIQRDDPFAPKPRSRRKTKTVTSCILVLSRLQSPSWWWCASSVTTRPASTVCLPLFLLQLPPLGDLISLPAA